MSSSNNQFSKVTDTSISGSALLGALSGDDIQALSYQAAVNNYVLIASDAGSTPVVGPGPWLQQAAISQLGVVVPDVTATSATINLGSDSGAVADGYCRLLNINTSSDRRILNFTALNASGVLNMACPSSVSAYVKVFNGLTGVQVSSAPVLGSALTPAARQSGKVIVTGSPSSNGTGTVTFRCSTVTF